MVAGRADEKSSGVRMPTDGYVDTTFSLFVVDTTECNKKKVALNQKEGSDTRLLLSFKYSTSPAVACDFVHILQR